jgi:hypothetical protein
MLLSDMSPMARLSHSSIGKTIASVASNTAEQVHKQFGYTSIESFICSLGPGSWLLKNHESESRGRWAVRD